MRLATSFREQMPELFGENWVTIHDDGCDAQAFEKANTLHGEISGALRRDASIRIVCDRDDLHFSRAKMNGNQNRHQADASLIENQHFCEIDRRRGGRIMDDDNKRKLQEVDLLTAANTQGFGYDHENLLTTWNRATTIEAQAFGLTAVGDFSTITRNGVTETRTHSAVHEATSITSPTAGLLPLSYDAKGNLTKDDHGTALAWDPENRLRRARIAAGSALSWSGAIATYGYVHLGSLTSNHGLNQTGVALLMLAVVLLAGAATGTRAAARRLGVAT